MPSDNHKASCTNGLSDFEFLTYIRGLTIPVFFAYPFQGLDNGMEFIKAGHSSFVHCGPQRTPGCRKEDYFVQHGFCCILLILLDPHRSTAPDDNLVMRYRSSFYFVVWWMAPPPRPPPPHSPPPTCAPRGSAVS